MPEPTSNAATMSNHLRRTPYGCTPSVGPFSRFSEHLAQHPGGWLAWGVALLTLALPVYEHAISTPARTFFADTLPVVPTVVQTYQHSSRNLSTYLRLPRQGRWEEFDPSDSTPYCVRPAANGTGKYSSYPAGMEVFAWPAVLLAAAGGTNLDDDWELLRLEERIAAVIGGLCVALFFLSALRIGSPAAAWVTTALFATGSVVPSILTQLLWQQTGVVFWTLVILLSELRSGGRPGVGGTIVQGIASSLMLACRPSAATFLVPFGLWVLGRDHRRGALLTTVAIVAYLPWAFTYWTIYHNPLGPSMSFLGQTWTMAGNVLGVLFSPGRGLFVYQPWMLLLFLLFSRTIRSNAARPFPQGWYTFCFVTMVCHIVLIGSWGVWWGGYSWGSRLASEVVAPAGLLVIRPVEWLLRWWWGWLLLAGIGSIGIAMHYNYTHGVGVNWNIAADIDRHPERLWDWQDPPFLYRGGR